jgi:CheY-like chemotaxis protein
VFRTITCITQEHSPWLLAVAVLVCLVAAARAAGADDHVAKPVAAEKLFSALSNVDAAAAA